MRSNLKAMAALAVAFGLPVAANAALTVTVDGVGGDSTHYAKLSEAVTYVNANSSVPNIINVTTTTLSDNTQIVITQPMTINGDGNGTSATADILVDVATIRTATDVGMTGRAYIEVESAGDVTISDLQIHPKVRGTTTQVDPFNFYKPTSGAGNYTLNRVKVSSSHSATDLTYFPPETGLDLYSLPGASTSVIWYSYLDAHGIYALNNGTGAGTYNTTLNDCVGAACRSAVVYIENNSGSTTINGGLYGHAGDNIIKINGATNVNLTGTQNDRLRLISANRSSAGYSVRILGGAIVPLISYVDIYNNIAGTVATPANGSGIYVENGTVTSMQHVRTASLFGFGLEVGTSGTVTAASDCTFHGSGSGTIKDPIRVDAGGSANFNDSIFTAFTTSGTVNLVGLGNFLNCAIPTDGYSSETLNTANPFTGTPLNNILPTGASPHYTTTTLVYTDPANGGFLRPNNSVYDTAHTGGTPLYGGAGPAPSAVNDWEMY